MSSCTILAKYFNFSFVCNYDINENPVKMFCFSMTAFLTSYRRTKTQILVHGILLHSNIALVDQLLNRDVLLFTYKTSLYKNINSLYLGIKVQPRVNV